jgi:putative ATP-dependent endonuclease of OLD family
MHIEYVKLKNFRCFGDKAVRVRLGPDITALIGGNGAGKSAFIEALRRVFGVEHSERTLRMADVHFGPKETPELVESREVVIDVVFAFPELANPKNPGRSVPMVFPSMTGAKPGGPLKARIRLEALWEYGVSPVDEIESKAYWVTTLDDVPFGEGKSPYKIDVNNVDRNRIRLVHIPATRNGEAVTKEALSRLLTRLELSGDFGKTTESEFKAASEEVQKKLDELPAIEWVTGVLKKYWNMLHREPHLKDPKLMVLSQEFTKLLRSLSPELSPSPDGRPRRLSELSEGQTSLFFLALSATVAQLDLELAGKTPPTGFSNMSVNPPALTIYAIEEPENHLAPFYLSRLMELLAELCHGYHAMGIITSHSPSALRRLPPSAIRHLRLRRKTLSTRVSRIPIPKGKGDAGKFVRAAVIAQPEIYFANLVILGEGDSEQIVIPRVAHALGVDLDPSFVAFAPLGGRHVNHFWKLLRKLGIPHLTLLDYDLGRKHAGPLRVKYAVKQLAENGIAPPTWAPLDKLPDSDYWKGLDADGLKLWRNWLRSEGVFFSYPLDLDLMMLSSFPKAYGIEAMPDTAKPDSVLKSVFGQGGGLDSYVNRVEEGHVPTMDQLYTYDAKFKKRDKPGSHLSALTELTDDELKKGCPPPLRLLIRAAAKKLTRLKPVE